MVITRNWLGNPANFKGTNKDHNICVGRSMTLHNLLFCAYTLWLNYVTVTFLLVSSSGTYYKLLCLCRLMAKTANKKHRTKNFAKLPNHLPLLTMMKRKVEKISYSQQMQIFSHYCTNGGKADGKNSIPSVCLSCKRGYTSH